VSRIDQQLPDVRDGLTRAERLLLYVIREAEREFEGRRVPTALIYGRVVEHENMSVDEFQRILARLAGGAHGGPAQDR
jgi:hypothetical protein